MALALALNKRTCPPRDGTSVALVKFIFRFHLAIIFTLILIKPIAPLRANIPIAYKAHALMAAAVLRPASAQGDAVLLQSNAMESTSARSLGDLASGPSAAAGPMMGLVRRGPKRSPIANLFATTTGSGNGGATELQRDSSEAVLVEPADPIQEPDSLATTPMANSDRSPDSNLNYGMS